MARRMLIDASHPEETRVVIVSGNRLEEFDYETASKHQIKGNIYLAKVTRVEPSLQAAFVDYGGNRHGFLAFNEIHPDYYRIPIADRERLYGAEAPPDAVTDLEEGSVEQVSAKEERRRQAEAAESAGDGADDDEALDSRGDDSRGDDSRAAEGDALDDHGPNDRDDGGRPNGDQATVDVMGGDEEDEIDRERRRMRMLRNYRIQEVIKRRQIMLVQVTKEERGNKGAALTTYLSLAGRYCVLMPNTARGGGVSRKIGNVADRKRLRAILDDLEIPQGMAVIVRTAGSERSKAEIKRDYEYLMRLWDKIRQLTLESISPALIHEEGNLIKRSIRDLYSRDIDEVLVDGEESYRSAKDFMRMLMPSHASRVKRYKDEPVPLFQKYRVESQLDEIHTNTVRLKSGGYLVMNPTEALVAIDVNSGRATRERHIEETALKTNLEAAVEVARQLRLRDLAGLIVIDFIDMEENRNNTAVERKLKEALRGDRARIQLGRISAFGLLEMSRQRLRPSIIEASSQVCPHCNGVGHIRSTESSALQVLRAIEEEGLSRRCESIRVQVPTEIALYMLNQKRAAIVAAEQRYVMSISVVTDDTLIAPDHNIERLVERSAEEIGALRGADAVARSRDEDELEPEDAEDLAAARADEAETETDDAEERRAADDGKGRGRKRRGRRRKPRRDEAADAAEAAETGADASPKRSDAEQAAKGDAEGEAEADAESDEARRDEDGQVSSKPRRGRRGGRRRKRREDSPAAEDAAAAAATTSGAEDDSDRPAPRTEEVAQADHTQAERTQADRSETGGAEADVSEPAAATAPAQEAAEAPSPVEEAAAGTPEHAAEEEPAPKRRPRRRTRARPARDAKAEPEAEQPAADSAEAAEPARGATAPTDDAATAPAASGADGAAEAPRQPSSEPQEPSPANDAAPATEETGEPEPETDTDTETETGQDEDSAAATPRRRTARQQPRRGWWQRLIEG